jgi:Tfp pilus assembly PilM family ATPase
LVLSGVQDRLKPLKAWLFPPRVLVELEERWMVLSAFPTRGGSHKAQLLQRVPLPAGSIVAGEPRRPEALGDLLGDLLLEQGLGGVNVVASLPILATHWRVVQWATPGWPASPEKELEALSPDLGLYYPLSVAYLSTLPLPRSRPEDPATSLLVATRRSVVQAWIEVFSLAGVGIERLDAAQISEWRALEKVLEQVPSDGLYVLVDLYEGGTRVVLYRHGIPEYEQTLQGAGRPVQVDSNEELLQRIQRCVGYWREQDASITSVQVGLVGSLAARQDLINLFKRSNDWSVDVLDVVERGWLQPPDNPGDVTVPPGGQLLRLAGLLAEELNP